MSMSFYDPVRATLFTTPGNLGETGRYTGAHAPTLRVNGAGDSVASQYKTATWTYSQLSHSDFTWWITTLLQGTPSKRFGIGTSIKTSIGGTLAVTSLIVRIDPPGFDYASGGFYYNVKIVFDQIL